MRSSDNEKPIQSQPPAPTTSTNNCGYLAFPPDVTRLIFFGLLGHSNNTLNTLKLVNRSFYHFITKRNIAEIDAAIPILKSYFEKNPGCNAVSFNAKARYIPLSVLTNMLTHQNVKSKQQADYLNECNLKAFMQGTICKSTPCKNCDKTMYTNLYCLVLGAHQEILTEITNIMAPREIIMPMARTTQNVEFISFMCKKVNADIEKELTLTLSLAIASKNTHAINSICVLFPEARLPATVHAMLEALKHDEIAPEKLLEAIQETINLTLSMEPKRDPKEVIHEILTKSYRLERFRQYQYTARYDGEMEKYNGPIVHCAALTQNSSAFKAILDFYDINKVEVSNLYLEFSSRRLDSWGGIDNIKNLSLMDCVVETNNFDNITLMIPREALTAKHVSRLSMRHYRFYQDCLDLKSFSFILQTPLSKFILSALASNLNLDNKKLLYVAYIEGLKNHCVEYLNVWIPGLLAKRNEWGEIANVVNPIELLASCNLETRVNLLRRAAILGWNPNDVNEMSLLQSHSLELFDLLDKRSTSIIYRERVILQLLCEFNENHANIQVQADIQNAYINNHNLAHPSLMPYLVMAWLKYTLPKKFVGLRVSSHIQEAMHHFSKNQVMEGLSIFKEVGQLHESERINKFENIVTQVLKTRSLRSSKRG